MLPLSILTLATAATAFDIPPLSRRTANKHTIEVFWSPKFVDAFPGNLSPSQIVSTISFNRSDVIPNNAIPQVKITGYDKSPSASSTGLLMQSLHAILSNVATQSCGLSASHAGNDGRTLLASQAGVRVVNDDSGDVVAVIGYEVSEDGAGDGGKRESFCLPRSASAPPTVGAQSMESVAAGSAAEILQILRQKEADGFKVNNIVPINVTRLFEINDLLDTVETTYTPDPASADATIDISHIPGPGELDLFSICNISGITHDAIVEVDGEHEQQHTKQKRDGPIEMIDRDRIDGEDILWDLPTDNGPSDSSLFDTPLDIKDTLKDYWDEHSFPHLDEKKKDAVVEGAKHIGTSSLKGLITSAPKLALAGATGGVSGILGAVGKAAAKKVAKEAAKYVAKKTGKKIFQSLTHADEKKAAEAAQRNAEAREKIEQVAERAAREAVDKAKEEMWAASMTKDAEMDRMRKTIEELKGRPKSILKTRPEDEPQAKKVSWDGEVKPPALAPAPASPPPPPTGKPPPPAPGIEIPDDIGGPLGDITEEEGSVSEGEASFSDSESHDEALKPVPEPPKKGKAKGKGKQKVGFSQDGTVSPPHFDGGGSSDGGDNGKDKNNNGLPAAKLAYCEWTDEIGNIWEQWIPVVDEHTARFREESMRRHTRRDTPAVDPSFNDHHGAVDPCAALESALFQAKQLAAVFDELQREENEEEGGDEDLFAPQLALLSDIQGNITALTSAQAGGLCGDRGDWRHRAENKGGDPFADSGSYFGVAIGALRVVESGSCDGAPELGSDWLACGRAITAVAA